MTDLSNAIAVIGLAGKFPGAANIKEFWQNLCNGVESIQFFSQEENASFGIDPELINSPNYIRANGSLDGVDLFDAGFFGISPREAEIMDPQQRLFMECAWEALENAVYDPDKYNGRIGVYAGVGINHYLLRIINDHNRNLLSAKGGFQIFFGNDKDFIPTRVSYKFNLRGPSVNINTACSSSLVAIHFACQSLLDYHCDMALAGGVSIQFEQKQGYIAEKEAIGATDGHVRAFDEQAQGTVGGSGLGVVCLKRLEDAVSDGDFIYATILSTAINNDGALKVSYSAPSLDGEARVITEALALAEVEPETISYIEAHGTGTLLGDPIEIAALTKVFREKTDLNQFCAIGSVKTNIGHLAAAAGVSSFIKTVLALHFQKIPKSLNYEKPNPKIDFENSPFFVNAELRDWQVAGYPRRAGVSSFGIGGTNSHAILEEAPLRKDEASARPYQLIQYSAKTQSALERMRENLLTFCQETPEFNIADMAYSLMIGRKEFSYRRSIVCRNRTELITALQKDNPPEAAVVNNVEDTQTLVFLFPGENTPYGDLGFDLYKYEPSFAKNVTECVGIYQELFQEDFTALLDKPAELNLPVLFSIEYSLAMLLMEWGIKPTALQGSLAGELVAATVAGIFTLKQALHLSALQARFQAAADPKTRQNVRMSYQKLLAETPKKPATIPLISSISGDCLSVEEGNSDEYWYNLLQASERSLEVLPKTFGLQGALYLTIGPEGSRINPGNDPAHSPNTRFLYALTSSGEADSGFANLLDTVGKLWRVGVKLNHTSFYQHEKRQRIPLPAYPFERQRYWIGNAALNKESMASEKTISDWFYVPVWKQSLLSENKAVLFPNSGYVIFIDQEEYGKKIAVLLEKENKDIISVTIGNGYRKLTPRSFEINPEVPGDYEQLFDDLNTMNIPWSQIIHAYNLSTGRDFGPETLQAGFFSLIYIAKALGKQKLKSKVTLTILSNNAQDVLGDDLHYPWKATLLGPCKVIPQEYPEIECRHIDITLELLAHPGLVEELTKLSGDMIIAFRGRHRWLPTYEKYLLPEQVKDIPLKEKGVYLITGGLGGIGLACAEFIAENYHGRLILTGQSPFPEDTQWDEWLAHHPDEDKTSKKIKQLKRLHALGAEIIVQVCDVADNKKMAVLFDLAKQKWGGVNGVFHLAGIAGSGIIQMKEQGKALQVLQPKITGTMVLCRLCDDQPMDFFILFSSINAILGGVGQAEYCSANSFLDAFAHYQADKKSYPIISINWDTWRELGMAHRLLIDHGLNIEGDYIFKERLSPAEHWFLAEHRMAGQPVLPGTGYLEILLQSLHKFYPSPQVEFTNVYFQKPFIVQEGQTRELFIVFMKENETEFNFEMKGYTKPGSSLESYAKGRLKPVSASSDDDRDLGKRIYNQFQDRHIPRQVGFKKGSSLMRFGSRFTSNCDFIQWGDTESLGHFILPEEFWGDIGEMLLHPALMDSATGYLITRLNNNYLPFGYEKIRIFAPIPKEIFSYAKHPAVTDFNNDILKMDLRIFNENWEPLVFVDGYTLRRVAGNLKPSTEDGAAKETPKKLALRKEPAFWISPKSGLEALRRILSHAKQPQIIVTTSDLPKEYEMKETFRYSLVTPEKGQLSSGFQERPPIPTEFQQATSSVAAEIARIWQENLGIKNIGINDDFLALGGDSLIATQVISQLRNVFQIDIPLSSIFEDSTINNTAKRINALLYVKNSMSLKNQGAAEDEEEIIL